MAACVPFFSFLITSQAFVFTPSVHAWAVGAYRQVDHEVCSIQRRKHDLHLDQSLTATRTHGTHTCSSVPVRYAAHRDNASVTHSQLLKSVCVCTTNTQDEGYSELDHLIYIECLYFIWLQKLSQQISFHLISPPPSQKQAFMGHEWLQTDPLPVHPEAMLTWPTMWIKMKVSRIEVMESLKPHCCCRGCSVFDVANSFLCNMEISK